MSEGHVRNGLASRKRKLCVDEQIAHGSCIINSFASELVMRRTASKKVTDVVSRTNFSKPTRQKRMRNPAMQEIATTLVLYAQIVPEGESRSRSLARLKLLFDAVDKAAVLLSTKGPDSTAMATLSFMKGLTVALGLLE